MTATTTSPWDIGRRWDSYEDGVNAIREKRQTIKEKWDMGQPVVGEVDALLYNLLRGLAHDEDPRGTAQRLLEYLRSGMK